MVLLIFITFPSNGLPSVISVPNPVEFISEESASHHRKGLTPRFGNTLTYQNQDPPGGFWAFESSEPSYQSITAIHIFMVRRWRTPDVQMMIVQI